MPTEPELAFVAPSAGAPGLEIRVNFGVFGGRAATPAEIDELGRLLVPRVGEVSIVAEERRELSDHNEAAIQQVRVEIAPDRLPAGEADAFALAESLLETTRAWASACIAERHVETAEL